MAFRVDPSLTRQALIMRIPGGRRFNVIQCERGWAAVRCSPSDLDDCVSAVRSVDPSAEPLRSSGTLRTLRDRYPVLKETKPPRPVRRRASSAFYSYPYV